MHDDTEQSATEEEFERAVDLLDRGQNREALEILLPFIEQCPEHVQALNKAGVAYARLEEMIGAERCFLRSVIADPQHVAALSNLGNIYLERDDTKRAIALYKKALKYDPDYSAAHNNIAAAYRRTGDRSKQVEHFKKGQRLRLRSQEGRNDPRRPWIRRRARTSEETDASGAGEAGDTARAGGRRGCLGSAIIGALLIVILLVVIF
ncbi:MAG: tetratricopeptide repeat protein [Bacillota bacterium]